MSTPIAQDALNRLHETLANLVTHYCNGIITDLEFVYAVGGAGIDAKLAFFKAQQPIHEADLSNLFDPNTGLRYPTAKPNDKLTGGQDV